MLLFPSATAMSYIKLRNDRFNNILYGHHGASQIQYHDKWPWTTKATKLNAQHTFINYKFGQYTLVLYKIAWITNIAIILYYHINTIIYDKHNTTIYDSCIQINKGKSVHYTHKSRLSLGLSPDKNSKLVENSPNKKLE